MLIGTAQVSSIKIDQEQFKGHVLAEDFFNAEATPTIVFRSTEIRPAADGSVEVDGELTDPRRREAGHRHWQLHDGRRCVG